MVRVCSCGFVGFLLDVPFSIDRCECVSVVVFWEACEDAEYGVREYEFEFGVEYYEEFCVVVV